MGRAKLSAPNTGRPSPKCSAVAQPYAPFNPLLSTGTLLGAGGLGGGSTSMAATSTSMTEMPSTCRDAEGVRVRWCRSRLHSGGGYESGKVQVQGCTDIKAHTRRSERHGAG